MKWIDRPAVRFLIAGGLQTIATYGVYLLLLPMVEYPVAYLVSFGFGILFAFVLNSVYVFRVPLRWTRLIPYPLVYCVQLAVGLAITSSLVEFGGIPEAVAPVLTLLVVVPLAYFGNRMILGHRSHAPAKRR